jgi:hypothetical protein
MSYELTNRRVGENEHSTIRIIRIIRQFVDRLS